ncbi:MAG: lamin tail domain-containing protein [archaeon]|nr:MAG: lamin tail domain-containing protein [archaeon]
MKKFLGSGGKLTLILIFLFLFCNLVSAEIYLNEIMPHSNNSMEDEWVEIYNSGSFTVNLTNWKVGDLNSNDSFNLTILPNSFILIVDSNVNNETGCSEINVSCFELTTIGNGLKDSEESIFLFDDQDILISDFSWNSSIKSSGDSWSFYNSSWKECSPTPGSWNNCSIYVPEPERIELTYPSEVNCGESFQITFKTFNLQDSLFDVKVDIKSLDEDKRVGRVWDGSKWLSTMSYVLNALNSSMNYGESTLTFKIENFSGEAILMPRLRKTNTTSYTDFDAEYISVICDSASEEEREGESTIKISKSPNSAKFGETIEIEVEIYKGDTSKYSIKAYVEDADEKKVSDESKIHLRSKYVEYEGSFLINLKCKEESGKYYIIVEGLGEKDKDSINLDSCHEQTVEEIKGDSQELFNEEEQESISTNPQTQNEEYRSPITGSAVSDKSSGVLNILPYFFVTICLLLTIYLIIKKI